MLLDSHAGYMILKFWHIIYRKIGNFIFQLVYIEIFSLSIYSHILYNKINTKNGLKILSYIQI